MKKTTRYILIGLGFAMFFVVAPAILLYVTGTRLQLDGRDSRSTGILDVKSEPSNATVTVDNHDKNSTPAIVRFLNQGEYIIKISKDGYYDWSKRLAIEAGKVTYAQVGVNQVQLIKQADPKFISDNVDAFVMADNTVWFTKKDQINRVNTGSIDELTSLSIPHPIDSLSLLRDERHLLGSNSLDGKHFLVDTSNDKIISLPMGSYYSDVNVLGNQIIYRDQLTLKQLSLVTKSVKVLKEDVSGFTILNNTAYFIEHDPTSPLKSTLSTAIWNGSDFLDFQPLVTNAEVKSDVKNRLLITNNKELFCACNNKLFRVGEKLDLVSDSASATHLDLETNELTFTTSNELWFYNFLISKPQLLTRNNASSNQFLVRSNIGYGFVGTNFGLEAVEIDTRDRQNRYLLMPTSGESNKRGWIIAISPNQKTVFALENGQLRMVEIRN